MSHYKVLGIRSNASIAEIKQAYRLLALQLHPDLTNNNIVKTEQFKRKKTAYDALINSIGSR